MIISKTINLPLFTRVITTYKMNYCTQEIKSIFEAAVTSVQPQTLLRNSVKVEDGALCVGDQHFALQKPCYLVGFGKAVLGMAVEMERILGANLARGIVTVPLGISACFKDRPHLLPAPQSKIAFIEGAANNLPDVEAFEGAIKIKNLCDTLKGDDLLIVLISGGGSALLPLPVNGIELEEKIWLIKELGNRGANIIELNSVRKRISQLKGGGLAKSAYPSRVVSLILSDVIDDPLDFIASGPTVSNLDKEDTVPNILRKYGLIDSLPASITRVINENCPDSFVCDHVSNFVIGNNNLACLAAQQRAENLNYESAILSTAIQGDAGKIGKLYAELAVKISSLIADPNNKGASSELLPEKFKEDFNLTDLNIESIAGLSFNKAVCVIAGGEPTVVVEGAGSGGRNQHLALSFSREINRFRLDCDVSFLSCGTDGIDGPTDAAGAIGSSELLSRSISEGLDVDTFLRDCDSNTFYSTFLNGEYLIKPGHTGTNVMDVHILLITPKV